MIKFVFRWAFRLLLLAVVLVIGLLLLKDTIARSFAEQQIRKSTGFDAKLGKLQFNLLEPRLTLENLVLYNPPEFGGSILLDAPDIHIEYAPRQLASGKIHLNFLRLRIRELNIVENNGRTNIMELLHPATAQTDSGSGDTTSSYKFTGVDLLNLTIGKVRLTDLSRPKRNQEIPLGQENHIVRNIRSEQDFLNVLLKLVFRAGVTIYVDESPRSKNTR